MTLKWGLQSIMSLTHAHSMPLTIKTRDQAEAAMAMVATLEQQKADLEHRLTRYRTALKVWALDRVPVEQPLQLRHGRIHVRAEGGIVIDANIQA